MWNIYRRNRAKVFRDREADCYYCPEAATTIRQGAPVCAFHAIVLRKVGWS